MQLEAQAAENRIIMSRSTRCKLSADMEAGGAGKHERASSGRAQLETAV